MIRTLIALSALTLIACTEPDARAPVDEADVIASAEAAGELTEIGTDVRTMAGPIAVAIDFGPAGRERTELRVEHSGPVPRLVSLLRDELGLEPELVRDADNRLHLMGVDGVGVDGDESWIVLVERAHRYSRITDLADVALEAGDRVHLMMDVDADFDGVGARLEVLYGTDDSSPDSDGDGLSDWAEIYDGWMMGDGRFVQSDPASADSDGDGMSDREERSARSDPRHDDRRGGGHGDDDDDDDDRGNNGRGNGNDRD